MRLTLSGEIAPIIGNALFCEYEDVLARDALWNRSLLECGERESLADALMSVSLWVPVYFLWRISCGVRNWLTRLTTTFLNLRLLVEPKRLSRRTNGTSGEANCFFRRSGSKVPESFWKGECDEYAHNPSAG